MKKLKNAIEIESRTIRAVRADFAGFTIPHAKATEPVIHHQTSTCHGKPLYRTVVDVGD